MALRILRGEKPQGIPKVKGVKHLYVRLASPEALGTQRERTSRLAASSSIGSQRSGNLTSGTSLAAFL